MKMPISASRVVSAASGLAILAVTVAAVADDVRVIATYPIPLGVYGTPQATRFYDTDAGPSLAPAARRFFDPNGNGANASRIEGLNVNGDFTIQDTLDVNGLTQTASLRATGATTIAGQAFNVAPGGDRGVAGGVVVNDLLDVNGTISNTDPTPAALRLIDGGGGINLKATNAGPAVEFRMIGKLLFFTNAGNSFNAVEVAAPNITVVRAKFRVENPAGAEQFRGDELGITSKVPTQVEDGVIVGSTTNRTLASVPFGHVTADSFESPAAAAPNYYLVNPAGAAPTLGTASRLNFARIRLLQVGVNPPSGMADANGQPTFASNGELTDGQGISLGGQRKSTFEVTELEINIVHRFNNWSSPPAQNGALAFCSSLAGSGWKRIGCVGARGSSANPGVDNCDEEDCDSLGAAPIIQGTDDTGCGSTSDGAGAHAYAICARVQP